MSNFCRALGAVVIVAAGAAPAFFGPSSALAAAGACTVPGELMEVDAKLPHLRAKIAARRPVRIVAIGGASTAGRAAGAPGLAYPKRLQQALARLFPSVPIIVVNKGVPRQSTREMLRRFKQDVIDEHPVLVIWETGITDAVRGTDTDDFVAALDAGIAQLKARGIDVILVDMQFSRWMTAIIDFDHYLSALRRVAEVNAVYVFPRFEMMRYWEEQNLFNFEGVARADRARLAAGVYRCIGEKLAETIRRALQ
jgi:acyl-CoA thioesterase I